MKIRKKLLMAAERINSYIVGCKYIKGFAGTSSYGELIVT